MYLVFLAGGLASGKSTVARHLETRGALRIDLDQISREVIDLDPELLGELAATFGKDILLPDGKLDRALLASRAFESKTAAKRLEDLMIPAILTELKKRLAELKKGGSKDLVIVEVPLLDRLGQDLDLADEIVVCVASPELRAERAYKRGMLKDDIKERMSLQPSDEWLRAHADTIFDTSVTMDELLTQVDTWWNERKQEGE